MLHPAVTGTNLPLLRCKDYDKDLTILGMLSSCPAMQVSVHLSSARSWLFIKTHGESELPALQQEEGIGSCCSPGLGATALAPLASVCLLLGLP